MEEALVEREHGGLLMIIGTAFSRPQNLTEFATPKIMTPEISGRPEMTLEIKVFFTIQRSYIALYLVQKSISI